MTEGAQSVADAMPIKPSYEQIIGSVKHSGMQEILRHAGEDEQRLNRELERIEADEDLTDEAKERMGAEAVERFGPKISERYRSAREKAEASAETCYLFSLPFPSDEPGEKRTFAHGAARCKDTQELLAVQAEAEAISQKMGATSLQEMTRERSKMPGDRGIRHQENPKVAALKEEFDEAMRLGGVEGRIKALAVDRIATALGMELDQIVENHRTSAHYRALEDHWRATQAAFALQTKARPVRNPFEQGREKRRIGTYSSGPRSAVIGGSGRQLFPKRDRRPAWK